MNKLKHLVTIVFAMLLCITATVPVFATVTPPTDADDKTNIKGLPGDFGKGEGFRLIGGNEYGYTISFFFRNDGNDVSTTAPCENGYIRVLKTVTSDVGPKTYLPVANTWQNQIEVKDKIEYVSDFGGNYAAWSAEEQMIGVKGSVDTAEPISELNEPRGNVVFDTTYASKSKLGNPLDAGFAERVKTQYELNSQTSEIAEIFKTYASHLKDEYGNSYTSAIAQLTTMAERTYWGLAESFRDEISAVLYSEFPDDEVARGQLKIDMVLPVSDKCVVGWGILIEPMVYQYVVPGSETSSLLPDKFNNIMVSAIDCAYINGASRAFASNILAVAESAPLNMRANAEAVISLVTPEWMNKLAEKGEFAWNLKSISRTALPNSALLQEPWWGMPAKDPKVLWDDLDMAKGAGVGAYRNTRAVLKTVEPCCRPARMGTIPLDKCPCTGGKRCGCGGHTCSGPSECDCYTPPVKQGDVFIDEEHLSEELELLLVPTKRGATLVASPA